MYWYLKVFKQYATLNGRARRKEFWMFVLFSLIFRFALIILDNILGITFNNVSLFYTLCGLIIFILSLAVTVRRLHNKEYWIFVLYGLIFAPIFASALTIYDNILETTFNDNINIPGVTFINSVNLFSILYNLIIFIPGIAVTVRRLHDIGKSGWFIFIIFFIIFIPLIGGIWFLVLMCTNGEPGENRYGLNPKEITN